MINCSCIDCDNKGSFKSLKEAEDNRWYILGINIGDLDYYAICPTCDYSKTNVSIFPAKKNESPQKKSKLINSKAISYE